MVVELHARNLLWAIFALPGATTNSCVWAIPPRVVDYRNQPLHVGEAVLDLWMEQVDHYWAMYAANQPPAPDTEPPATPATDA
jgi:hypothetical protein